MALKRDFISRRARTWPLLYPMMAALAEPTGRSENRPYSRHGIAGRALPLLIGLKRLDVLISTIACCQRSRTTSPSFQKLATND